MLPRLSEKQLFSRDFRLSLAKRPEKSLVKTRPLSMAFNGNACRYWRPLMLFSCKWTPDSPDV